MLLRSIAAAGLGVVVSTGSFAQTTTSYADPATLRRSTFSWTQAELEFGFGHWDEIYSGRIVPRGTRVRELARGAEIPALKRGTPGGDALEKFINEQKVAGLIVLQNGVVRLERYALGHSAQGRWVSQSVSKSITSTLVGAAVKDGYISSIDDFVPKYIPGLRGSVYDSVTIRQLMTMSSGVKWNENYTDSTSDVARLYQDPVDPGENATVSFMRKLQREARPGSKWVYKTGETHLLGVLVTAATKQTLSSYLSAKIWAPYGMEQSALWTTDRTHHEQAGCCLVVSLRDYARYGQFVLEGARINGRSIVPDGWFTEATRPHFPASGGRGYGYQWWTMPNGAFAAIGIFGQLVYIDPARQLVIALNSAWPTPTGSDRSAARSRFIELIAASVDAEATR